MFSFELNELRSAVTLLSFFSFVAIVAWALAKRNKAGFDEAAQLPFLDERTAGADSGRLNPTPSPEHRNE